MSPSASAHGLPTSKTSTAESSYRRRSMIAAARSSKRARSSKGVRLHFLNHERAALYARSASGISASSKKPTISFGAAGLTEGVNLSVQIFSQPMTSGYKIWTDKLTPSVNPAAPKEIVGYVPEAGIPEAERAVKAARSAFGKWSRTPFEERAQLLDRAATIMDRRRYELSAVEVFEVGKPWAEADGDIREAMDFCRFYAERMRLIGRPRLTQHVPGEESYQHYWPRGVALVIAPWNFPIAILCGMVSAALVTGNTVIMKPSEQSIICGAMFMQILEEAGVPTGVLNFLSGHGSVIGAHLVDHKDVDLIAFTGSREVGLKIWESAGKTLPGQCELKRVVCEMGGKNPVIIDSDADLDEAIVDSIYSAFGYQGQKCSALSRLILLEENY